MHESCIQLTFKIMASDGDTGQNAPQTGSLSKKYRTFLSKQEFSSYLKKIEPEDYCYKEPIYQNWRLAGYWSTGMDNIRIQTWMLGYYICQFCSAVCGLHDETKEYWKLRLAAGEELCFTHADEKNKFSRRKSANTVSILIFNFLTYFLNFPHFS